MHTAPSIKSTATRTTPATTFKPRVRRLGPGRYLVESASRPGRGHTTTATSCSCMGFSYRRHCKHVALVQAIEPSMVAWYGQVVPPACPAVEEEHASGVFMVTRLLCFAIAGQRATRQAQKQVTKGGRYTLSDALMR